MDSKKLPEDWDGRLITTPQEACNRISDVVQQTIKKMETVEEEKLSVIKKAQLALEACNQELDDKTRDLSALKREREKKKQQLTDELEGILRLKQAEAEMFDSKAREARREAESLKRIALAKDETSEEDYASRYLKQRLHEAEAEKQYLVEKMKLQAGSSSRSLPSSVGVSKQPTVCNNIQDLMKNLLAAPLKGDGQSRDIR